jgi:iron complex outermembrane recepter protein
MNAMTKTAFRRVALAASIGPTAAGLIFISESFAQNPLPPPAPGTAEVERVIVTAEAERAIVTGSKIPTAEEIGSNPVFSLNRDLINKSGQGTTVEELLKSQPVAGANSIPVQNNANATGGPRGAASVSLRGFDPGATLVLLDGRRVAPYPGTAVSGAAFFDLNTIPIAAVQSIEILKDGASTSYGADAVAGVVNIKLYKNYRGAQLTLYYGNTLDKDAGLYSGDILFGTGDDKTSITGDIFFYHHTSLFNRDRGNSNRPPFLSSDSSPYNLQLSSDVAAAAGGQNLNPGGFEFTTPPNRTNGLAPASNYIYSTRRVRGAFSLLPGFNFNAFSSSFPEQERWGGYAAFEHRVWDDQLRIYGDFYYADVKTHDELAPPATGAFETPGAGILYIPPHSPLPGGVAPPNTPTLAKTGMPPDAFNPFNPFEQIISGGTRARLVDFGNRLIDNENIAELFTVGVQGDKLFNGSWGYDGAFRYSQIRNISQIQNVSVSRFNRIVNAADSIFNPALPDYIGQTTPYNPFNDFRVPIATNLPLINFARLHARDLNTSKLATLDLNIYTTDLFDLPGGGVGFAFGGLFGRETLTENPDDAHRLKDEVGELQAFPLEAGRKEYALYAEALIPITSPAMRVPGFFSLKFSAGGRFEAFLSNDTNALVPKVAVRWQPFDEQLTLRSTWGEGFVEPSLTQLYGPVILGLAPTSFMGDRESETATRNDPNPHLGPEHSRNWTGGMVYTPKWIPWGSLTLTIDLWDIERTGVVMVASPQSVIERFLAGRLQLGEAVILDPSGKFVSEVVSPFINGGRQNARGVDLGVQYQLETRFGTFTSLTRATYLDSFILQFAGAKAREVAGRTNFDWWDGSLFGFAPGDAWYKWKGISTLDWTWHNFDLNWTAHFFDGFWEEIYAKKFDGFWKQHYVHPTWFFDAQLSYSLIFTAPVEAAPVAGYSKDSKQVVGNEKEAPPTAAYAMPCWKNILNNSTITVGVNDILGADPPKEFGFERSSAIGYPGFAYDNLGRFWYVRLIKKF